MAVNKYYDKAYIATATTTTVKTGSGYLHALTLNTTAAGTITLKDGATVFAILKASVAEQTFFFDCTFATSLVVVTGAASDLTISYL